MPPRLIAFNKPFGTVCQFSRHPEHRCLADFVKVPNVYPAGRLDTDSEGLLLLTADGALQHRISHPRRKLQKAYWVQVEGMPNHLALQMLRDGIDLGDFTTQACKADVVAEPASLWPRAPPIRVRRAIPTTWLEIRLTEGKNRQIRRMTAKAGHPTLRLVRHSIGPFDLDDLQPGQWREVDPARLDDVRLLGNDAGTASRVRFRPQGDPAR